MSFLAGNLGSFAEGVFVEVVIYLTAGGLIIGGTEKILEHSRTAFRIGCSWSWFQSTEVMMIKDTITRL